MALLCYFTLKNCNPVSRSTRLMRNLNGRVFAISLRPNYTIYTHTNRSTR